MKRYSSSDYKQSSEEKFERFFAHSRRLRQQGRLQLALSIFSCRSPSDAPAARLVAVLHSSPFDSN